MTILNTTDGLKVGSHGAEIQAITAAGGLYQLGTAVSATAAQLNGIPKKAVVDTLSGTILPKVLITPGASATTTGADYHKLFAIGDVTGTTAYGFGDPAKPTTGLMACFGRTAIATGNITDTGLDVRVINKLVNSGTNTIQGAYIKAKNYSTGTVSVIKGLFVEVVNDGTATTILGIDIGSDGTVPTADIRFSNGQYFVALATAITANSTATTVPAGSIGITSNATGVGKLFVSDGSKWQYASVSS